MVEVISCAPDPHHGESQTVSYLKNNLTVGNHIILTNYYLPRDATTLEIDLVVINRQGVWLIEVKDWYGRIDANSINWQQAGQHPVSSPISSIDYKAKVKHGFLAQRGMGKVSVNGFVVLVQGLSRLKIDDPRSDRVFSLSTPLINALTGENYKYRSDAPTLGQRDMEKIRDALLGKKATTPNEYIGRYRIVRIVRQEGQLTEYEAEHTQMSRKARIKRYQVAEITSRETLAKHVRRFRRDIEALTNLGGHPNLVVAYDFTKDEKNDAYYYLFIEWVEGRTLREVMHDELVIPLLMQITWVQSIANGLAYCHQHGIIHRNLTPDNIYIRDDGVVKVGNFDFAKIPSPDNETLSITGYTLVRTPYTAPEQLTKPHEVDTRADIYALGVIWYELLSGADRQQPIDLSRIQVSVCSDEVREVVQKMLATRRTDRFGSCRDFISELDALKGLIVSDRTTQ